MSLRLAVVLLSACLYVYLPACTSVCLSVHLPVSLNGPLHVCTSLYPSVRLCLYVLLRLSTLLYVLRLSLSLTICKSLCQSVQLHLSACLYFSLSLRLSVCLHVSVSLSVSPPVCNSAILYCTSLCLSGRHYSLHASLSHRYITSSVSLWSWRNYRRPM